MTIWGTDDLSDDTHRSGGDFKLTRDTKITVLSGAGISAESEIPTFRGPDGLWNDENIMKIATPRGFAADPLRGWKFYNERRANMAKAKPNPAHLALAKLECDGYDVVILTQNIDRLHHQAGSTRVIELHGTLWELKCGNPTCDMEPFENTEVPIENIPPLCETCGTWLRPNVVFFEEQLDHGNIHAADIRTKETDLFLVIGTSGVVYPAAAFAQVAKACGAYVIEFNIDETALSPICDLTVLGPCGETLSATMEKLINEA